MNSIAKQIGEMRIKYLDKISADYWLIPGPSFTLGFDLRIAVKQNIKMAKEI